MSGVYRSPGAKPPTMRVVIPHRSELIFLNAMQAGCFFVFAVGFTGEPIWMRLMYGFMVVLCVFSVAKWIRIGRDAVRIAKQTKIVWTFKDKGELVHWTIDEDGELVHWTIDEDAGPRTNSRGGDA